MGADEATIAQAKAQLGDEPADPVLLVLPECWFAVRVFFAMDTQWHWLPRADGSARRVGLRYTALPVVMASLRTEPHRVPLSELLPQLRVMEAAALQAMAST